MSLALQKRLAAELLKCGESRVRFDSERMEDIESAITREDIRRLIDDGVVYKVPKRGISKGRKERGRRGPGSRKKGKYSIVPRKERWMMKVRAQRRKLKELKDSKMLVDGAYRKLYKTVKSGAFKSVSAMMDYIKQRRLLRRMFM